MGKYDDIINLPHHVSPTRRQMTNYERAAQFSPFAALTGFDAKINETARRTDFRRELSEYEQDEINECLRSIIADISEKPAVKIIYFVPDSRKSGGEYREISGNVRRIDEVGHSVIFTDGSVIQINDILSLSMD